MTREARELVDEGIYHVFNRGNNKMALYRDASDYGFFLESIGKVKQKFPFDLFHYCLMDNHYHFLLQVRKGDDLPRFMHSLQLRYAIRYAKKYGWVGHVFQERFRSPRIPEESYYLQCGRYIERNPVAAGMVSRAENYLYSSARHYVLGKTDALVNDDLYYSELGATPAERQAAYRSFLSLEEPYTDFIDQSLLLA